MRKCRDVAYLISSEGLKHAGWFTRLLVRLHLVYCKACRQYALELAKIGRVSRETGRANAADPKTVERLEGAGLWMRWGTFLTTKESGRL